MRKIMCATDSSLLPHQGTWQGVESILKGHPGYCGRPGELAAGSSHLCGSFAINNAGLCGSAAPSFLPASRRGAEGQYLSPLRHLSSISVHCRLGLEKCRTAVLNIRIEHQKLQSELCVGQRLAFKRRPNVKRQRKKMNAVFIHLPVKRITCLETPGANHVR